MSSRPLNLFITALLACSCSAPDRPQDSDAAGPAVDTDGDGLADAEELLQFGTSPELADSDGDGLSDRQELVDFGFDPVQAPYKFNPLVADVPQLSFELTSTPHIAVVGQSATSQTIEYGMSETTERANAFTTSHSNSNSHSVEMTHTVGVGIEQEISYGPASFGSTNISLNYEFSHATTD